MVLKPGINPVEEEEVGSLLASAARRNNDTMVRIRRDWRDVMVQLLKAMALVTEGLE